MDNFNDYYPVSLKRARQAAALADEVYIADGDLADRAFLGRLFDACAFTHVLHLAAQARLPDLPRPRTTCGSPCAPHCHTRSCKMKLPRLSRHWPCKNGRHTQPTALWRMEVVWEVCPLLQGSLFLI